MSLMFKFSWEILFFETRDAGVFKDDRNKLFASNKKQINNHTLCLTCFIYTCHLYIPTTVVVSLKRFFLVWLLFFVNLCGQKSCWRHWTSIFMYQGSVTFQGGRVEDHRMMFMRHLHLLQSHIQVKLYI